MYQKWTTPMPRRRRQRPDNPLAIEVDPHSSASYAIYEDDLAAKKRAYLADYARHGVVAIAAEKVGVGTSTIRTWRKDDDDFRAQEADAKLRVSGTYQRRLHAAALRGDTTSARWLLERMNPQEFGEARVGGPEIVLPPRLDRGVKISEIPVVPPVEGDFRVLEDEDAPAQAPHQTADPVADAAAPGSTPEPARADLGQDDLRGHLPGRPAERLPESDDPRHDGAGDDERLRHAGGGDA